VRAIEQHVARRATVAASTFVGKPLVKNVTETGITVAGGAAVFAGDPTTFAPTVHWQVPRT